MNWHAEYLDWEDKPRAWAAAWTLVAAPLDPDDKILLPGLIVGPLHLLAAMPPEAFDFLAAGEVREMGMDGWQQQKILGAITKEEITLFVVRGALEWPFPSSWNGFKYSFTVRGLRCANCTDCALKLCEEWARVDVGKDDFRKTMLDAVWQVERRQLLRRRGAA